MPATSEEMARLARVLARELIMPDDVEDVTWEDGSKITAGEIRDAIALAGYEIRRMKTFRHPGQRRAMRLLRSFLTPEQHRQLRNDKAFRVEGSAGGVYRLHPHLDRIEGVERHGKHWFTKRLYCLHDPTESLPVADEILATLLLLRCDEPAFLASANSYERPSTLWNGDYLRRVRAWRRQR